MKIIHSYIKCLHCGKEIEVFDEDFTSEYREIYCDCGYTNELDDIRVEVYEKEF